MAAPADTIAAIATPHGRGGIGVVRISGPRAGHIAAQMLGQVPPARHARYCAFKDARGAALDTGIALFFAAPASYTGEDMLELHGHGGTVVLEQLLARTLELGARLARPGEFTERAFLNGRIDLLQAEAVADLIESASAQAARGALRSLQGEFSRRVRDVQARLTELRAFIEGAMDFPEEEIDFLKDGEIAAKLAGIIAQVDRIVAEARQGQLQRDGIEVVIAGPPNAGKSTLLNRLAGRDAAIVTDIPGTTRDLVSASALIDGLPVQLTDTAGLRASDDIIEQEGVRRAREAIARADLVLLVLEYGRPRGEVVNEARMHMAAGATLLVLANKIDLFAADPGRKTAADTEDALQISAKTGAGIDLLRDEIKRAIGYQASEEGGIIARRRHLQALQRARDGLDAAARRLKENAGAELMAEDLRLAQQSLGELTGEFAADDLLAEIFSRFCIGK